MLALGAPRPTRARPQLRPDQRLHRPRPEPRARSAAPCWSPGSPGSAGSTADSADRLNRRHGLRIGHRTRWTRLIDGSAALGQSGTRAGPDRHRASRRPSFEQLPAVAPLPRGRGAQPDRPGLHRADDRRRGARADVTRRDRRRSGAGRPVPRHDGGRGGRVAATRWPPTAATSSARPRRSAGRSARPAADALSRLGEQVGASLSPSTVARRSAALRRFFGFLVDEGLRERRPVGGACRGRASSGRCRESSTSAR